MPLPDTINLYYQRYLDNDLSKEELAHFLQLLQQSENEEELNRLMDITWQQMFETERIETPVRSINLIRINWYKRIAIAASILIVISLSTYFAFFNKPNQPGIAKTSPQDVEAPKSTKATIMLADGRSISIDSLTTIDQSNVTITKSVDGKIVYTGSSSEVVYNTLSNPRGSRVIDMTLSDGSHVWLNAGSSITYPIAFTGNERKITMTGEAYFEIAKHDLPPALAGGKQGVRMPFIVSANNKADVTVLGTHFNVNAYDDEEETKITLLEGSVKVDLPGALAPGIKITPGQQAVIGNDISVNKTADLDQVMAWRNNLFSFDKADIKTIMKEVSRWYDVEVVYKTEVKELFRLKTSRNTSVSNIFRILEAIGGVHLEVDGKQIIVTK